MSSFSSVSLSVSALARAKAFLALMQALLSLAGTSVVMEAGSPAEAALIAGDIARMSGGLATAKFTSSAK